VSTVLDPFRRGNTFVAAFTLGGGWEGSDFTGSVKWTLRQHIPDSSITTDDDAVHQASVANGQIVFVGAVGTVTIPASATTTWVTGRLYWDLQGVIDGSPDVVYTIDDGTLFVTSDITRSA
jgi:hypothetical protein